MMERSFIFESRNASFSPAKTFCHNALRRLPIEFSGNIYGMVSSAGYFCICFFRKKYVLKELQCDQGS